MEQKRRNSVNSFHKLNKIIDILKVLLCIGQINPKAVEDGLLAGSYYSLNFYYLNAIKLEHRAIIKFWPK